ncbi:hypothetical protein DFH28DRAFT_960919, partial [Melampsora americana]
MSSNDPSNPQSNTLNQSQSEEISTQPNPIKNIESPKSEDQTNEEEDLNQALEEDLFGGEEEEEDENENDENENEVQRVEDEEEMKKRQALEYLEDPSSDHLHHSRDRHIAEATLLNLPLPFASDQK